MQQVKRELDAAEAGNSGIRAFTGLAFREGVFFATAFFADAVFFGPAGWTPTLPNAAFFVAAILGLRTGAFLGAGPLPDTGTTAGGFEGNWVAAGSLNAAGGRAVEASATGSFASLDAGVIALLVEPRSVIEDFWIWCK